jgi:hypothetical protein
MASKGYELRLKVALVKKETPRPEQLKIWSEVMAYSKQHKNNDKSEFVASAHWENWYASQEKIEIEINANNEAEPEVDREQQRAETLLNEAHQYLDNTFRLSFNEESSIIDTFNVTDLENKVAKKLLIGKATEDALKWAIRQNSENRVIPIPKLEAMIKQWRHNGREIPYPKIHGSWLNTDEWVTYRCMVIPQEGPMPTWAGWLNRLSDPKAWAAWWYGVISGKYTGRQVLWVAGVGEANKTWVSNFIAEHCFGDTRGSIDGMAVRSSGANFLAADFVDNALIIWDDCANTFALLCEGVKQLTQGEHGNKVRIEKKGLQAYSGRITTRMSINSNYNPELTGDKHARSRLLYVYALPPEEGPRSGDEMTVLYREELPAFLAYAEKCYQEVCPNNYKIEQTDESLKTIDGFEEDFYKDVVADIFHVIYLDPEVDIAYEDIKNELIAQNQKYNKEATLKHAFDYLEKRLKVTKKRTNAKKAGEPSKTYYSGIGIIGAKSKKSKKQEKTSDGQKQDKPIPEDIKDILRAVKLSVF